MLVRAVTILSLHAAALFLMALSYQNVSPPAEPLRAGTSEMASLAQELRVNPL